MVQHTWVVFSILSFKKKKQKNQNQKTNHEGPWFSKIEAFKDGFKSLCVLLKKMWPRNSPRIFLPWVGAGWEPRRKILLEHLHCRVKWLWKMGSEKPPGKVATLVHPLFGSLSPWGAWGTSPAGPQRVQGLWQLFLPDLFGWNGSCTRGKHSFVQIIHQGF